MTDQLMAPHSSDAEIALLGSIIIDPYTFNDVSGIITGGMFYLIRHQYIWETFERITARNEEIDVVTVADDLRTRGKLEEVGGLVYLTKVVNTPGELLAVSYAQIIERAAIRRGYLQAASTVAKAAYNESDDINDVIDTCEGAILAVSENRHKGGLSTAPQIMRKVFDKVEAARLTGVTGQKTGLTDIDRLLGGLQETDLIIVASRPGVGKTSLGLTISFNRCKEGGCPLFLSKEMGEEQLGERMIAMETGISTHKMRTGQLSDAEFSQFTSAVDQIGSFRFVVDDSSNMPLAQVLSMCRRAKREHGIDLIIVDYIQLIQGIGENRHQEVSSVSRALKALARELKVPVLAMAQLNRNVEARSDKRPMLSDLAESGAIEQDADVVMFIYRDELYNPATERPNQADVIIAKHRNGPTGVATLYFRKELTQFSNLAKTGVDYSQYGDGYANRRVSGDAAR